MCKLLESRSYTNIGLLVLDEIGYLPIDKNGADLLFQIISARYESGSLLLTTNKAFKDWPTIFNNDSTLTSAVLDRLLHHCETVVIKASSIQNAKDQNKRLILRKVVQNEVTMAEKCTFPRQFCFGLSNRPYHHIFTPPLTLNL